MNDNKIFTYYYFKKNIYIFYYAFVNCKNGEKKLVLNSLELLMLVQLNDKSSQPYKIVCFNDINGKFWKELNRLIDL